MRYSATVFEENIAGGLNVRLQFNIKELMVYSQKNQLLFSWPYADIQQSQGFMPPAPANFTHKTMRQFRLVIEDEHLYKEMRRHIRKENHWRDAIKKRASIISISLAIIFSAACLYFFGIEALARYLPWSFQQSIGKRYLQDIVEKDSIVSDPVANRLFASLYRPLIKTADINRPMTIFIIKSPIKNAVTLPGGYILVFTGLIKQVKNPDAMAGILAHELAHVKYQHNLREIGRASAFEMVLVSIIGYNKLEQGTHFLISMSFSRESEQQADSLAMDYLDKLKISSLPLKEFFQSMNDTDELFMFSSTHPSTQSRINAFSEHDNSKNNKHLLSINEWLRLKRLIGC